MKILFRWNQLIERCSHQTIVARSHYSVQAKYVAFGPIRIPTVVVEHKNDGISAAVWRKLLELDSLTQPIVERCLQYRHNPSPPVVMVDSLIDELRHETLADVLQLIPYETSTNG